MLRAVKVTYNPDLSFFMQNNRKGKISVRLGDGVGMRGS